MTVRNINIELTRPELIHDSGNLLKLQHARLVNQDPELLIPGAEDHKSEFSAVEQFEEAGSTSKKYASAAFLKSPKKNFDSRSAHRKVRTCWHIWLW